jgi:hypothetical protein
VDAAKRAVVSVEFRSVRNLFPLRQRQVTAIKKTHLSAGEFQ